MMTRRRCHGIAIALALGAAASGLAFAGDTPDSPQRIQPALIGSKVPAVGLTAVDGTAFDLPAKLEGKPSVLIFYRGGW